MCAIHPFACQSADAHRIAAAIDQAAPHEELRAHLVVYAWHESEFRLRPSARSWDARAHRSCGPWQQRCALVEAQPLEALPRCWLHDVQASSLAGVDSSPSSAWQRAHEAVHLLELVRGQGQSTGFAGSVAR